MTGRQKVELNSRSQGLRLPVRDGLRQTQRGISVFDGVQRKSGFVSRPMVLVAKACLFFLKVSGVRKENPQEIDRCGRAIDHAAKSLIDEPRKITGMVNVCVRQHDGIDRPWINRRRIPIPEPQLLQPLEKTAINQDPLSRRLEQKLRSGDCLCRTKERQLHRTRIPRHSRD